MDSVVVIRSDTDSGPRPDSAVMISSTTAGGAEDIRLDWLAGASVVGLTAGASAPPAVVDEIITALSGLGPLSVSERITTTESIRFGLPKEVRH